MRKRSVYINVPEDFARTTMALAKINGKKREQFLEDIIPKLKKDLKETISIDEKIKNEKKSFFPKL